MGIAANLWLAGTSNNYSTLGMARPSLKCIRLVPRLPYCAALRALLIWYHALRERLVFDNPSVCCLCAGWYRGFVAHYHGTLALVRGPSPNCARLASRWLLFENLSSNSTLTTPASIFTLHWTPKLRCRLSKTLGWHSRYKTTKVR